MLATLAEPVTEPTGLVVDQMRVVLDQSGPADALNLALTDAGLYAWKHQGCGGHKARLREMLRLAAGRLAELADSL